MDRVENSKSETVPVLPSYEGDAGDLFMSLCDRTKLAFSKQVVEEFEADLLKGLREEFVVGRYVFCSAYLLAHS